MFKDLVALILSILQLLGIRLEIDRSPTLSRRSDVMRTVGC